MKESMFSPNYGPNPEKRIARKKELHKKIPELKKALKYIEKNFDEIPREDFIEVKKDESKEKVNERVLAEIQGKPYHEEFSPVYNEEAVTPVIEKIESKTDNSIVDMTHTKKFNTLETSLERLQKKIFSLFDKKNNLEDEIAARNILKKSGILENEKNIKNINEELSDLNQKNNKVKKELKEKKSLYAEKENESQTMINQAARKGWKGYTDDPQFN